MNRSALILVVYICFFTIGIAQQYRPIDNIDQFLATYKNKANELSTLKSKFVQEKSISLLEKKIVSEGLFLYKAPSKLRMEYIKPYSYLFILNTNKVIIRNNNKETSINTSSNRIFKTITQITIDCVSGNVFDNSNFKFSVFENSNNYQIILKPILKDIASILKEIRVVVSKQNFTVEKIEMFELSDDYTQLVFSEKEINQPIADASFLGN